MGHPVCVPLLKPLAPTHPSADMFCTNLMTSSTATLPFESLFIRSNAMLLNSLERLRGKQATVTSYVIKLFISTHCLYLASLEFSPDLRGMLDRP